MTNSAAKRTLSVPGLSAGTSAALIVLFALCALSGLAFPSVQATHAWVTLFTLAPATSPQAWLEGIFFSAAFGVVGGSIVAASHNAVAARGL
jgi:hypothetical protein